MRILADEGFNGKFVNQLRTSGFSVDWILEQHSGISDDEVIEIARSNKQILLTEDKDFGEWVFAHKVSGLTIILLRYSKEESDGMIETLNFFLENEQFSEHSNEFIVMTKNKIRRRRI